MPIWLQIIIAIVGAVGTICGIFGITAYVSERQKHKAEKKNRQEDKTEEEIEKMKHEAYKAELRSIIGEALLPVATKLDTIESDLGLVKNGLQKDLYVDLENLYKEYCKKGFASLDEKKSYDSLYWAYHNLGKNGVADGMHDYVMKSLPDIKAPAKRKSTSKKKLLLEEKK